jgi:acyl carrier protein
MSQPKYESIRNAVAEVAEIEPAALTPETVLYDLPAFDSLKILSIFIALDDLGVQVPQEKASQVRTFGDILKLAGVAA